MAKIIRSAPISHLTRIVSSKGKNRGLRDVSLAARKVPEVEISRLIPVVEHAESKLAAELKQRHVHEEAVRQGYAEGQQKAQQELHQQLQQVAQLVKNMTQQQHDFLQSHEDHLVDIIFTGICKIMGDHWIAQEGVVAVVKQVITQINQQHGLKIHVAPADYAYLNQYQSRIIPSDCLASVTLAQDEKIALGGCRVESAAGSLDGRLEHQMQQLKIVLLRTREQTEVKPNGSGKI